MSFRLVKETFILLDTFIENLRDKKYRGSRVIIPNSKIRIQCSTKYDTTSSISENDSVTRLTISINDYMPIDSFFRFIIDTHRSNNIFSAGPNDFYVDYSAYKDINTIDEVEFILRYGKYDFDNYYLKLLCHSIQANIQEIEQHFERILI